MFDFSSFYYHILQLFSVLSYWFCCSFPYLLFLKLFWYVRVFIFFHWWNPLHEWFCCGLTIFSYIYTIWCATFNSIYGFLSIRYISHTLYTICGLSHSLLLFLSSLHSYFVQVDDVHTFSFSHNSIQVFIQFYN